MKINCDQALVGLDGAEIQNFDGNLLTVGKALANMLIAPRQDGQYDFDKMKLFVLAEKFYKGGEVEIDDADLKKLMNVIKTDTAYGPLVSGKILLLLEKE